MSGRKRHLLVDTQGLVLEVNVHAAALQDRAPPPREGSALLTSSHPRHRPWTLVGWW